MPRILALILFLTALSLCAETFPAADPELISSRIVELLDISQPLFLEIQAGDLTSDLDFRIRQQLLKMGADLRESLPGLESEAAGADADSLSVPRLDYYALKRANLVQVTMELGGTTIERKSFLSYSSERFPLYNFQVRQIALPRYQLTRIDSLGFVDQTRKTEGPTLTSIKWFEPVLASTVLASIIYLLWTTE